MAFGGWTPLVAASVNVVMYFIFVDGELCCRSGCEYFSAKHASLGETFALSPMLSWKLSVRKDSSCSRIKVYLDLLVMAVIKRL